MQPKSGGSDQGDLFRARLDQILNRQHPLYRLANSINWSVFEKEFGPLYTENFGRPGLPIRLLVGLHYLKHAYNVSNEAVVDQCIGKGKAHKKYEFGCKVSLVSTSQDSWVVGVQTTHGNPYDGHTLKDSLNQAKAISGWRPKHAYCDKGYRGVPAVLSNTEIHLANKKKKSMKASEWKWYRRRSGIEPIIGQVKQDHRMDRNYLKGKEGDKINAILAGCGFNIRKLLRAILLWLFKERFRIDISDRLTFVQLLGRQSRPG